MKLMILLLVLVNTMSTQSTPVRLTIELRTNSNNIRMSDDLTVSVTFHARGNDVTIWNALGFGAATGLHLRIVDSSGHENRGFPEIFHPLPPDRTGKNALISLMGNSFAGFDFRISARQLFPKPGKYILKCIYSPPLPRDYFQGQTIWGKEDGSLESAGVSILVSE